MQYMTFELAEELDISETTMHILNHVRGNRFGMLNRTIVTGYNCHIHMPSAENEVYQEQMRYIMYQAKHEMAVHRQLTEEQQMVIRNTYFSTLNKYQREFAYVTSQELPYVLASAQVRSLKFANL